MPGRELNMATVRIVLVTYAFFPSRLFASIEASRHDVRWCIFFHGRDPGVCQQLEEFAAIANAVLYPHGINRGLARSWNDAIRLFRHDGDDVLLLVNDDLFFFDGAFDEYIDFILSTKASTPNFGQISILGLETGTTDPLGAGAALGQPRWQGLACSAIGEAAIAKVGFFDQNFWPVYFTDTDYVYRLSLASLPQLTDTRVLIEHNRSLTTRLDPELRQFHDGRFRRGSEYYLRKWGGLPGQEKFTSPFAVPQFDYAIPVARIDAPYGGGYDREDLAAVTTSGLMQGE